MPIDVGVLKRLDRAGLPNEIIRSTGVTNYTWQAFDGDIQLDSLNQFVPMEGTTKLAQGIFKAILTPKGSVAEDPTYGTSLSLSIGQKMDSGRFADIQTEIIDTLVHYNIINQDNSDSDEVIEVIDEVEVVTNLDDPRVLQIQISVTTESGKSVKVTVPQVI